MEAPGTVSDKETSGEGRELKAEWKMEAGLKNSDRFFDS